jgi:hypothetical protein
MMIGVLCLLGGSVDPLEGSVIVLPGCALVTLSTYLRRAEGKPFGYWLFILGMVTFGVAAMFVESSMGGLGGSRGISPWWGLLMVPYPLGVILGLVNLLFRAVQALRRKWAPASS